MIQYRCKYFDIRELVGRTTYDKRGEAAWELLDENILRMLDIVREKFCPLVVNNWHIGGEREWSGLRTSESPYYSPYSQHSFGRAFDCIPVGRTVDDLREYILSHDEEFPHIGGIEIGVDWLHIDGRNYNGIKKFGA